MATQQDLEKLKELVTPHVQIPMFQDDGEIILAEIRHQYIDREHKFVVTMNKKRGTIMFLGLGKAENVAVFKQPHGLVQRLLKAFWAWRPRHNKRFMAGVRRGLDAYHRGDRKPWSQVKKESGL
jgi:hypothetical protein